jgi:hypothetical protein
MVKNIQREDGDFKADEDDFLNCYFELIYKGIPYAYIHVQLAVVERFAYCHAYVKRFTAEIAREIVIDWSIIKVIMRAFGIEKAIGTKIDDIKVWTKFVELVGFEAENIRPSIINDKPCMMAVMEL